METGRWFIAGAVLVFAAACCRQILPSGTEVIEKEVIRERLRTDTVEVPLPAERVEVIRPDSSFLETSVAFSRASVDPAGMLHHSLENKAVKPKVTVRVRDSVIVRNRTETVVQTVEVPKLLNRWQRLRMGIGTAVLALAGGAAVCCVFRFALFRFFKP